MRQIFTFLILLGTLFSKAQSTIPISHAAGVTVTASSVYAPQPMASLNDFNICSTGNTGTYGGWMQLDLGASYSISTIRWWVNMAPSGNVTSEVWQVSPDAVTWTTVANTSGAHANNEERFISFTPVTGRYVRVTQSGTPSWFSIGEIIVNEPFFKDNIYQYMLPKILDNAGNVTTGNVTSYPYTFTCSKATTYQWKLNGTNISGATSQTYTATVGGNYTCTVTYPTAGSCGYVFTTNPISASPPVTCSELFNGTTDKVSVGNLGARPTEGSIAFWMNAGAASSPYPNVLSTGGNYDDILTGNRCIRFELNGGAPGTFSTLVGSDAAGAGGYGGANYTTALTLNTWHHVVLNWNSTTNMITGYLDGVQVFNTGCTTWPTNFDNFRMGQGYNATRLWGGRLDDVSIWNKQLTGAEITGLINGSINTADAALRAYYNFEGITSDGAGVSVINRSLATAGTYNGITGGTACTPKNSCVISNCNLALWLKADGTVTYNGTNKVSQWNDESGNNRHVTQAVAVNQPTFINTTFGNKPSVYFDGSVGKYFLNNITQNPIAAGAARTVFVVGRKDCKTHPGGGNGGSLLTFRRSALLNGLQFGSTSGGPVYIYSDGVNNPNNATTGNLNIDVVLNPFFLTYKVPSAGGKIALNQNGISQTVSQPGSVATESGSAGFTIGDREDVLNAGWSGWISEVLVYQTLLTTAEIAGVEDYFNKKYFTNTIAPFSSLPMASQTASDNLMDDGIWKNSYSTVLPNAIIASVKDNCFTLGTRADVVYADANAAMNGGSYTMRRHYVINVAADPAGTKRVRLYYTNADFTDLQAVVPSLTSAGQLVVTKYDGANEDGVYDITGGTLTFIPAAQITTGSAFGQNYLEFNVAGFSEFWIHTGSAALPLKFLSFNAQKCNKTSVCLDWKTANEQHVSHFEIERSEDGRVFRSVGTKSANNQPANSYNATDNFSSLSNTKIFYRIKQIDTDGKYSYSDVRTVMNTDKISLGIYPNPATDVVNIAAWANIKSMQLFDVSGRMLSDLKPQAVINVSVLQRGTYILKVQMKTGEIVIEKIVKQ